MKQNVLEGAAELEETHSKKMQSVQKGDHGGPLQVLQGHFVKKYSQSMTIL